MIRSPAEPPGSTGLLSHVVCGLDATFGVARLSCQFVYFNPHPACGPGATSMRASASTTVA